MKTSAFLFYLFVLTSLHGFSQADSTDYQKGVARINVGNVDEALIYFNKTVEANPKDPYAWFIRGYTKTLLELQEEAIIDFTKAIEIDPSYIKAYLNRGISRRRLLDFDGAQADYKLAILEAPNYAEAYFHRGYVFELLENKDSACYFYQRASDFGLEQIQNKLDICKDSKKSFDKHILRLSKVSKSKNYGFSKSNPVKVGGSPQAQREYLSLLRDSKGKPVKYSRAGSCCGYKLKSAPLGMAMLDRYNVTYYDENGNEKTVDVFITFYEYEEPAVLFGFKSIGQE